MKELSICLRGDENKLKEFYETLKVFINNENNESIFIDNKKSDKELVDFCFSVSGAKRLMIIDNDIQVDKAFVDDLLDNSYTVIDGNINYEVRKYISSNRPIYYNSFQTIIYDRQNINLNKNSSLVLNDFTPINSSYMEIYLKDLLNKKAYTELYLWYKHFILKGSKQLKESFLFYLNENNFSLSILNI